MRKQKGKIWITKLAWLTFYIAVAYTLFAAIQFKSNQPVKQVVITIESKTNARPLIGKADVLRYINKVLNKDLEIQKIEKLEVKKIEEALNNSSYIKKAEVYVDTKGVIYIYCIARTPIVRFDRAGKKGFYLDEDGNVIPLSRRATARVPLANGFLGVFSKDFLTKQSNRYRKVYELARELRNDEFLQALIEQIYVEESGKAILVPKLGRQKILFGEFALIDNKFEKLKAFYKMEMPHSGWNRFEYLNLEWEDQVVGQY